MERKGIRTERGDQNREIQTLNVMVEERDVRKRAMAHRREAEEQAEAERVCRRVEAD
jgi:hypothetical protein